MQPHKISGESRNIGKPNNWDDARDGSCGALSVRDTVDRGYPWMTSAWMPSQADLDMLNAGHPILLTINGSTHPVVALEVGTTADLA